MAAAGVIAPDLANLFHATGLISAGSAACIPGRDSKCVAAAGDTVAALMWFKPLVSTLQDELHESQAETATAWQKLGSLSERAAATEKELKDAQAAASEAEAVASKQIQQLKVGAGAALHSGSPHTPPCLKAYGLDFGAERQLRTHKELHLSPSLLPGSKCSSSEAQPAARQQMQPAQ